MNTNPFQITNRDILPSLLKKLLDSRLVKLEKKNATEVKELQGINRQATENNSKLALINHLIIISFHIHIATLSKCLEAISKKKIRAFPLRSGSNDVTLKAQLSNKDHAIRSNHLPIGKKTHLKFNPLYNISSRPLTPTPGIHSRANKGNWNIHGNVLIKNKKPRKTFLISHKASKNISLSNLSFDTFTSKSTSSQRNNKNKIRKNFSGVIGKVSQDNDELLTKISIDLFVRNSLLPMSSLFSFHQLFDSKFTLLKFLPKKDLLSFALINKSYGRIFLNEFITRIESEISKLELEVQNAKMTHLKWNNNHIAFSNKAIKAAELLDDDSYLEIFKQKKPILNDNVLFIYYLLLTMFNSSMTIDSIKQCYNNKPSIGYWSKLTAYLNSKTNSRFGAFIMRKLNQFDFSPNHLNIISQIASTNYNLINPSHYTKICPTTALVTFIVKDFLDAFNISNHLLILQDKHAKYNDLFDRIIRIKQNIYNNK